MAHGKAGQPNLNFPAPEDMEGLIRFQSSLLETIAFGYEDQEILDRICQLGEKIVPDSVATIMLLDDAGRLNLHVAPSASDEIAARLSGLVPGPEAGSCGNAAYLGEAVFVTDTLNDPRWKGLRHLAQEHGLQSCWSMPVFSEGRKIVGTFALTGFEKRSPSPFQRRLMEIAASIIAIVLERRERSDALRRSEERFRILFEEATDAKMLLSEEGRIVDVNRIGHERLGYSKEEMIGRLASEFVTSDNVDKVAQRLTRVSKEIHATYESAQLRKNGSVLPVEINTIAIELDGSPTYYSILRDITLRKEMEHALKESEAHLRDIVLHAPIGLATVSLEGRFLEANQSLCEITGYDRHELESLTFQEITHPDDLESDLGNVHKLLSGAISFYKMEKRYIRKDGDIVWVQLTASLLRDAEGSPTHFIAQIEDISERKLSEQRLSEALQMTDSVINTIPDLLFELDQNGTYLNVWAQVPELLAAPKEALLGRTIADMLPPDSAKVVFAALAEADQQGRSYGKVMPLELPEGTKWFELSMAKKRGVVEKRFIVLSRDITERMEAQARLNHLAYYDTLTDLPNRRFLLEKLDWALVQAKRHDRSLAIMFLDLDGFKQINDGLGHDIGDELLKVVAVRLTSCVRKGDIVSRQGGDEFIIVLPEISHPDDAALVAEKIIDSLKMPVEVGAHRIKVGTSIGIAVYPIAGNDDAKELMKKADKAMYGVKASGRNGYRLFGS